MKDVRQLTGDPMLQELRDVARQAVQYTEDGGKKPKFVARAWDVLTVFEATQIGERVGRDQGWDVFECGGGEWMVQKDDELDLITDDDVAIILAQSAGIKTDDDGNLLGKTGKIITGVGGVS